MNLNLVHCAPIVGAHLLLRDPVEVYYLGAKNIAQGTLNSYKRREMGLRGVLSLSNNVVSLTGIAILTF
jgi:hypothetical protein